MIDEGYIKFKANWTKGAPLPANELKEINYWRQEMYRRQLIGAYPNGIGYGNISQRWKQEQILISGSATGNFEKLNELHYALVKEVDLTKNELYCTGPIIASSESMSHAVIYQTCPEVHGVIHIHHLELWQRLMHQVPTTDRRATYGTPEMANSIIRLLAETHLRREKIFVMEGHREGVFAFGKDLEEAAAVIMRHYNT